MRFRAMVLITGLGVLALSGCGPSKDDVPKADGVVRTSDAGAGNNGMGRAGWQVVIDPATGKPVSGLPGGVTQGVPVPPGNADGSNDKPLVQETLPNGTVRIRLGDRFATPLIATRGCDGKFHLDHGRTLAKGPQPCRSTEGGEK